MKHAKRLTQSLAKLAKVEAVVKYAVIHTEHEMEYRRHLRDLEADLKYLSIDKKEYRIRFAKKVLSGSIFKKMTFFKRLRLGLVWIFTGKL